MSAKITVQRAMLCLSILYLAVFALGYAESLSAEATEGRAKTAAFSSKGKVSTLVIFAKFHGEAPEDSLAPAWAEHIFDPDLPRSLTHFYQGMSNGVFTVTGSYLRKIYSSNHPASYYTNRYYGEFNREILEKVDQEIDFGKYGNDGPDGLPDSGDDDGYVDFLFMNVRSMPHNFILGPGAGNLGLPEEFITDDPGGPYGFIRIKNGATQLAKGDLGSTVGCMAHELSHSLGLRELAGVSFLSDPDQPPEKDSAGMGKWGLMGYGGLGWEEGDAPVPLCAYSLEQLGWIGKNNSRILEVKGNMWNVVIEPAFAGGAVYKIRSFGNEYFLVCNRQASASYYDRHIPGGGLLIWHVVGGEVDLECADGRFADKGYPDGTVPDPNSGEDNLDFWARDGSYRQSHNGNRGDATPVWHHPLERSSSAHSPLAPLPVIARPVRYRGYLSKI